MSSRIRWTLRAAHREVAEAAIRQALNHIESCKGVGGSTAYATTEYERALRLIRLAERDLRISEGC